MVMIQPLSNQIWFHAHHEFAEFNLELLMAGECYELLQITLRSGVFQSALEKYFSDFKWTFTGAYNEILRKIFSKNFTVEHLSDRKAILINLLYYQTIFKRNWVHIVQDFLQKLVQMFCDTLLPRTPKF